MTDSDQPLAQIKPEKREQPKADPLAECLYKLFSFYGVQTDLKGLMDYVPKDQNRLKPEDVYTLTRMVGFKAAVQKQDLKHVEKLNVPTIVLLKNGQAVVYFPGNTQGGQVFSPDSGMQDKALADYATEYAGKVIVLYPDKSESAAETDHMRKGHAVDWFWKPIWAYWRQYSEILICSFFINLFVLALPLYTMNVYDRVVVNFVESTLIVLTLGIGTALVFDFLFKTIRTYLLEQIAAKISTQYDFDLMERLMGLQPTAVQFSVGEKANIFRELQGIRDFYATRLAPSVIDLPFFFLFVGAIYLIAPTVALVPITGSIIIVIVNAAIQVPINRGTKGYFTAMQAKSTALIETLAGTNTIRSFNAAGSFLFKWNLSSSQAAQRAQYNNFIMGTASNLSYLVTHGVHIMTVFTGVYLIYQGTLTIGGLIACSILSGRSLGLVMNMSSVISRLKQSKDVLKTIDKIFQLPHDADKVKKSASKGPFKGKITLQNVQYQYEGQARKALSDINLTIEAGESLGLIGRSGAGKTTLSQVIAGALEPQKGNLMLDSYAYESISPMELRRHIGIVPQDPFFFSGTMQDNIVMGRPDYKDEDLEKAIHVSGLDLVIEQTGHGLDMEIGEQGGRLSGGQKQSIALARALVFNPQIIIFDEPTTGMDNVLEGRIMNALNEYLKSKTFIMVTHRTTLLPLVSKLAVLDNGRIVAQGPRDEIIAKIAGGN